MMKFLIMPLLGFNAVLRFFQESRMDTSHGIDATNYLCDGCCVGTKTCSVIVIPQDHYCNEGNATEAGGPKSSTNCGGSKGSKGIPSGGQRGIRHLASFDDLSRRNLQQPKKGTKGSKGSNGLVNNEHNPDDLRLEYALSTQRCHF
jgi:hypothetical protein